MNIGVTKGKSEMPRKIRQLKDRGKGSHSTWQHPDHPDTIVLSGSDGEDAKSYQEKQVKQAIKAVEPQS